MEENYLPLFRKYRPQSFKDIVGQESLVKALSNAIELNRIANAYLFCGPRGTGKTSTARILAKSLNCEHGPTLEPCQKCASCVDITNAAGLDVIEIDAASNRGIQDAKELISQVQYAPINGKYKIFIIDEVHMLSNDAFNALLKTFEEPPKNVIFILATTEPHKVLETIISRCQRFDLKRITTDDIIKRLREISDLENIKITDDALFTIAKNVSGGLRDSLALLDQVSILGVKEEVTKDLIEELLGKINFDVLLELLSSINDENIELTLKNINDIYTKGNEPRNLAENFIEFLRNVILVLNSTNYENISSFTTLIKDDIEKINAQNFDKDKINRILNTIIEYYKEIKVSTNPYLWMELAAIAACKLDLALKDTGSNSLKAPKAAKIALEIQKPIEKAKSPVEVQPKEIQPAEIQPKEVQTKEVEVSKIELQEPKEVSKPQEQPTQPAQSAQPAQTVQSAQPVQAVQTSQKTESSLDKQDGVEIWLNIIQSIQSIPARSFYSGVAKLVSTDNNKIILGFVNDNALTQAKSEMKLKQLKQSMANVAPNYDIELIKIEHDTKTIAFKPKASQKPAFSRPQEAYNPPTDLQSQPQSQAQYQSQYQTQISESAQNPIKKEVDREESDSENTKKQYSEKVQNMIEQFNGRIIE